MTDTENLPALPEKWCWTTIGDIISFEYGKGLPKEKRDKIGNFPVFGSNGIIGYHSIALVEEPCLIVGRKGSAGVVHKSNISCWPIDTTYYVIPPKSVDFSFLYYLLKTLNLGSLDKSTAIPGLNRNDAYALSIPISPLPEQHRIVQKIEELFTDLDAGVQALEKAKVQIKNYRQMVLKLTLQGKLIQQDPADEPALKLIETIRADLIKGKIDGKKLVSINTEENLFELPDSWKWIRLGEVLTFGPRNGYSPKPVKHVTNVRALTLTATTSGKFRDDCFKYIDEEIDANSHLWLEENDLLIQRGNTIEYVGVAAVYKGASNAFIYPDLMMKMKVHPKTKVDFLHMVINSKFSRKYFEKRATGTAGSMPKINQSTIVNLPIPLPPLAEQNRIVSEIERRFSVIDQIEKTIDQSMIQAEKLRQSILKKAFEGKLVSQDPNDEPASVLLEKIDKEKTELEASNKTKRKPTSKLKRKGIKEMKNSEADIQNIKLYEILSSSNSSLTPKELWQLSKLDIIDFYENLKVEVEKGRIIERRPNDIDVYLEIGE
ncbi:MAG: restriction endonuclease subunit S [Methanosarcina sp.]|uniref:restriction endonuclease subunit S n=1 Tax=Methanosarcina sp. TaxID=2213 RepID=UPI00261CF183|nr:restriction endonuclease subunit S [Methanosarcina sp.]MDD3247402.1 restriction endonuclease subunit S [Methanosarcina sp.]